MVNQRIQLMDQNLKTFKSKIYEYRAFLVDLTNILPKQDTDLLSIRDEILADINKFNTLEPDDVDAYFFLGLIYTAKILEVSIHHQVHQC